MYTIGKNIKDPEGNNWIITQMWETNSHLCLGLIGGSGAMYGQMGGVRFPIEELFVTN